MGHSPDERALGILKLYAAGEISAREAAWRMGPAATEHDVYVGTLRAGLSVPSPPEDVVAAEVAALRGLFGRRRDGASAPYDMATT